MNHYIEIANHYFHEIEGWHLYPGRRQWHLWAWAVQCCLLIASFILIVIIDPMSTVSNGQWCATIVIALALVWSSKSIMDYRQKMLIREVNTRYDQAYLTANECCIYLLKQRLQVQVSEFAAVAKEIKELIELDKLFRRTSDIDAQFFRRKFYDPDSKQRILAGFLAMATLMTALFVRSEPEYAALDAISDKSALGLIATLMMVSAMLFLFFIGLHFFWLVMYEVLTMVMLRSMGRVRESKMALHYLVRHLVRYHVPSKTALTGITVPNKGG